MAGTFYPEDLIRSIEYRPQTEQTTARWYVLSNSSIVHTAENICTTKKTCLSSKTNLYRAGEICTGVLIQKEDGTVQNTLASDRTYVHSAEHFSVNVLSSTYYSIWWVMLNYDFISRMACWSNYYIKVEKSR